MFAANAVRSVVPGTFWVLDSGFTAGSSYIDVFWNNTQFLLYGSGGSGGNVKVFTSSNGASWTSRPALNTLWGGTAIIGSAAFGAGLYVAGGYVAATGVLIATSSDGGVSWTSRTPPSLGIKIPYGIQWNGTTFALCGQSNVAATSPDGITWTPQSGLSAVAGSSGNATRLVVLGTTFYALVTGSGVAKSSDGATWTYSTAITPNRLVSGGGKLLAATSASSTVWTSTDGVSWNSFTGPTALSGWTGGSGPQYGYALGQFFALGTGGNLAASSDGQTWNLLTGYLNPTVGATTTAYVVGGSSARAITVSSLGTPTFAVRLAYTI